MYTILRIKGRGFDLEENPIDTMTYVVFDKVKNKEVAKFLDYAEAIAYIQTRR